MNRTKIISNAELRLILGNSNLSSALASIHNQLAVNMLCDILQVNNLAEHNIVKEEVEVLENGAALEFRDFPVDSSTIELYNHLNVRIDTDIAYRADSHSNQILHLVDSNGRKNLLGYQTGQVLASYTGGFQNNDILTLNENASNDDKLKLDDAGTETEYTLKTTPSADTDIQIGATKEDTATNIANKTGSTADGAAITLLLGLNYVSTDIDSSISRSDMPEDLEFACALIAGGSIGHAERSNGVVSYKLGQKQVNFRNQGDAETTQKILDMYLSKYTPFIVLA